MHMIITFIGFKITFSNMGPKTTPSLISRGGYQIPPPLGGREIDTPWEIGLNSSKHLAPEIYLSNKIVVLEISIRKAFGSKNFLS